jgi:hypothetical protein
VDSGNVGWHVPPSLVSLVIVVELLWFIIVVLGSRESVTTHVIGVRWIDHADADEYEYDEYR